MAAILVGGFFVFWLESYRKRQVEQKTIHQLSWQSALGIGLFQCIALWPGFSRSLATIGGGILCKLSLLQAIQFSFLLDLLTSLVATAYKLLKHGSEIFQTFDPSNVCLGIAMAFGVGLLTINLFIKYLEHHGLKIFGYYRILLALIFIFLIK